MKAKIIALYKGDEYIDTGTVYKLAAKYSINYNTALAGNRNGSKEASRAKTEKLARCCFGG